MSIEADLSAFRIALDNAIKEIMETDILRVAQVDIMAAVEENVYAKYTPSGYNPYVRRREMGGLQDPNNIVLKGDGVSVISTPTESIFEMEVEDVAKDEDGFPVAEIIESGEGYHWKESRIYKMEHAGMPLKRPFYEAAEELLASESAVPYWIQHGLENRGFKF